MFVPQERKDETSLGFYSTLPALAKLNQTLLSPSSQYLSLTRSSTLATGISCAHFDPFNKNYVKKRKKTCTDQTEHYIKW